ncbi:hypothetical protein KI387_017985 [Taxus chinensis]|uniref:Uncharacterized protein n=1 Tax=Taxus chinensis TaxID=29808 RepID=A0AA38LGP1_TAXCH|nr:hypothetical protein KI387_017985 [Taxus chinensis]
MLRTFFCNRFQWHFQSYIHTNASASSPSQMLKKKVMQMKKVKKYKAQEVVVKVPESKAFLDTATVPMVLTAVAIALFMKLLMMYDDSQEQERIESKARKAPPEQGTVRMLSREEWEEIQEVRPRTPFESKIARPNARIRTGDPLHVDDVKDWSIDVLTDAFTRVEESIQHNLKYENLKSQAKVFQVHLETTKKSLSASKKMKESIVLVNKQNNTLKQIIKENGMDVEILFKAKATADPYLASHGDASKEEEAIINNLNIITEDLVCSGIIEAKNIVGKSITEVATEIEKESASGCGELVND